VKFVVDDLQRADKERKQHSRRERREVVRRSRNSKESGANKSRRNQEYCAQVVTVD
jgi:hypothetical protein